jgi:hypothetical protein
MCNNKCNCKSNKNDEGTFVTLCNCKYGSEGNIEV